MVPAVGDKRGDAGRSGYDQAADHKIVQAVLLGVVAQTVVAAPVDESAGQDMAGNQRIEALAATEKFRYFYRVRRAGGQIVDNHGLGVGAGLLIDRPEALRLGLLIDDSDGDGPLERPHLLQNTLELLRVVLGQAHRQLAVGGGTQIIEYSKEIGMLHQPGSFGPEAHRLGQLHGVAHGQGRLSGGADQKGRLQLRGGLHSQKAHPAKGAGEAGIEIRDRPCHLRQGTVLPPADVVGELL